MKFSNNCVQTYIPAFFEMPFNVKDMLPELTVVNRLLTNKMQFINIDSEDR